MTSFILYENGAFWAYVVLRVSCYQSILHLMLYKAVVSKEYNQSSLCKNGATEAHCVKWCKNDAGKVYYRQSGVTLVHYVKLKLYI